MRLLILILSLPVALANANSLLEVGDGRIDGMALQPYEHTWRQCSLQDGDWVRGADLTERMVVIGDHLIRIQQTVDRPDGSVTVSTSYFERSSLAPLRLEHRATGADGSDQGRVEHELSEDGYHGRMFRGEQHKTVAGSASSEMLHGGVLGLPLAALPFQSQPVEFKASMISMDATYGVTATWAGKETLDISNEKAEAFLIDVDWLHDGLGDVYPGGPDKSGGRYWVVHNPPPGIPYVPRYKTDTYAIEFVQSVCPND